MFTSVTITSHLLKIYFLSYAYECLVKCMYVQYMSTVPKEDRNGHQIPGPRVMAIVSVCEVLSTVLQEQQMLPLPSLQLHYYSPFK